MGGKLSLPKIEVTQTHWEWQRDFEARKARNEVLMAKRAAEDVKRAKGWELMAKASERRAAEAEKRATEDLERSNKIRAEAEKRATEADNRAVELEWLTRDMRAQATEAEKRATEAEKRATEAEKRAEEAKKEAKEAEERAAEAEEMAELAVINGSNGECFEKFKCPITQRLIKDPVITCDGHTYERKAIEEWFKMHDTSPFTGAKLSNKTLVHNLAVRKAIEVYVPPHKRGW